MDEFRERLFKENLKLAYWCAKKFHSQCVDNQDIEQAALIGLWKASESFRLDIDAKFSTYATKCIRNQILMEFRKVNRQTKLELIRLEDSILGTDELSVSQVVSDSTSVMDDTPIELLEYISQLSERDRYIIKLRMQGESQGKISKRLGISQSQCSRILKKIEETFREL